MGKKSIRVEQFIVKKKDIGLCIVNERNCTITYPNGVCKRLEQYQLDDVKSLHKHQRLRGTLL